MEGKDYKYMSKVGKKQIHCLAQQRNKLYQKVMNYNIYYFEKKNTITYDA